VCGEGDGLILVFEGVEVDDWALQDLLIWRRDFMAAAETGQRWNLGSGGIPEVAAEEIRREEVWRTLSQMLG